MLGLRRETVPTGKLEREIADLNAKRQTLAVRLSAAEQEHQRAVAKRFSTVTGGEDDAAVAAANAAVARTVEALSGFSSAITALDAKLAEAEHAFKNEQDRVARQRFADWCDSKITEIERAASAFQAAAQTLTAALRSTSRSGATLAAGLTQAANGFEIETGAILRDLTNNRDAVASGAAPIPDARPVHPSPPEPADIERVHVYTLGKALRWTEDGQIKVVGKYTSGRLPVSVAEIAIRKNVCDHYNAARCVEMRKAFPESVWASPAEALDLDALAANETERVA
jgi:hypothetical protein